MKYISVFNARRMRWRRKDLRKRVTVAEKLLWQELRRNRLGVKFKRQYSFGNYVVDFYSPSSKLAIELEGSVHITDAAHKYDLGRLKYFDSLGVKTLVFWNSEVEKNLKGVITKVSKYLSPVPSPFKGEGNGRGEV